jgi:hypothetical protein
MPKRKGKPGRPKRPRPSEVMLKIMRRRFDDLADDTCLTDPSVLLFMRMIVGDDRYIAAEAERWLAAKFKELGIKCSRETRIKAIAHWLEMDSKASQVLTNWLDHRKRAR